MSKVRLGILGNPENRRVSLFQAACQAAGLEAPCLSWERFLSDPTSLRAQNFDLLRIESPGENDRVARHLIQRGGESDPQLDFGEIGFLQAYHQGFCLTLDEIKACQIPCLNAPSDIQTMFHKMECHERFQQAGLSRPNSFQAPTSFDELTQFMGDQVCGALFLKPLHGSSSSGVCALRWNSNHEQLVAPIQLTERRLYNSLKVRTYRDRSSIQRILTPLLKEGMIAEQWIPKLSLNDGVVDLRIVVVSGKARQWLVRQSKSPMTNLHLGNRRGCKDELLQKIGQENLDQALSLAEKATQGFSDSLYAGVDILLTNAYKPVICEINAFGDLLPNLTDGNGETTYQSIVTAILKRQW